MSSIRRLVTQDLRPKPPSTEEKLLLTPALRVVPAVAVAPVAAMPEPEDKALADEAESAPVMPVFIHRQTVPDLAEAVTSIGAAVPDDGYESETGEIGPADAMPVPDWPASSWVAPDVISEVDEAEVVALSDDVPGWAQADDLDLLGEDVAEAPFTDAPGDDAGLEGDTGLGGGLDNDPGLDPNGDVAEAAALAELAAAEAAAAAPGVTELDEDMLREIVREIIREELNGSLGERITRNVRKLVRAEINRAMTTRDLE